MKFFLHQNDQNYSTCMCIKAMETENMMHVNMNRNKSSLRKHFKFQRKSDLPLTTEGVRAVLCIALYGILRPYNN